MLITDPFLDQVSKGPGKAALVLGDRSVSYRDLGDRAAAVAMRVREAASGQTAPLRCALLFEDGIDFISAFLGVAMAGGIALPLDPRWAEPEMARVLSATTPALMFVDPEHKDAVASWASGRAILIVREGSRSETAAGLWSPSNLVSCRNSPDAPFYIGLTSGTSGEAKAFIRSHRSWLASLKAAAVEFPVRGDDHVLVPGRLVHSLSLYAVVEALSSGATAHLMTDFDAGDGLDVLRRHPISRIHAVPTMYTALCDAAAGERFPEVRVLLSGGAKLAPALKSALAGMFPQAAITEYYGASELSFVTVAHPGCSADSVGRPFHGVQISLRDENGAEVPAGRIGRLYVRSAMVCSGYLRAADTSGFCIEDGWATVGDLAWRGADGCIHLAGREGGMMISGGLNIYPTEVEATLRKLPEIAEVAVFGVPDPYWGERVCALIRWADSTTLSRAELRARCSKDLDRRKCPQQFFTTDRFVRTESGKIALAAMRAKFLGGESPFVEIQ